LKRWQQFFTAKITFASFAPLREMDVTPSRQDREGKKNFQEDFCSFCFYT